MSYSSYLCVYGFSKRKIRDYLIDAKNMYNMFFKQIPNSTYWDGTERIEEFISKQLLSDLDNENNDETFLFSFCNHDGEVDDFVMNAFRNFAKCIIATGSYAIIKVSHTYEDEVLLFNKEFGIIKGTEKDEIDNELELMKLKYLLSKNKNESTTLNKRIEELENANSEVRD